MAGHSQPPDLRPASETARPSTRDVEVVVFCVTFDVDDTLYLERDYVRSGFAAAGRWLETNHGVAGFGALGWSLFEEGIRGNTFNIALPQLGLEPSPDLIRAMIAVYREHEPDIELLSDSRACIEAVRGRCALAVVTDGPLASQQAKVRALGVDWIDPVICTAMLGPGRGKPDPAAFARIEAHHDLHGAQCVYLSDNPKKDFIGPKHLGWQTVRVRRPGGLHFERPDLGDVDFEVPSLQTFATELLPILQDRGRDRK